MYSSFIKDYNPITASQLVGYNNTSTVTKWLLIDQDGNIVYRSSHYIEWQTWILDLDTLNISDGTCLTLKASVEGSDSTFDTLIKYSPHSNTVYLKLNGKLLDTTIYYNGYAPSYASPPVYHCSNFNAYNDSRMITKWSLHTLDGQNLFTSGRHRMNSGFWLDLRDLDIPLGTQMLLKAECIGGADSTAYIVLEYTIEDAYFANFLLRGDAFKTVLICNYLN